MTQEDIDSIKHRIYQELWKDGEIIKYIIASEVSYGVLDDKTPSRDIGNYRCHAALKLIINNTETI